MPRLHALAARPVFARWGLLAIAASCSAPTGCSSSEPPNGVADASPGGEPDASQPTADGGGLPIDAGVGAVDAGACVMMCSGTRVCQSTVADNVNDETFSRSGDDCIGMGPALGGGTFVETLHCGGVVTQLGFEGDWTESGGSITICYHSGGDRVCKICR